MRADTQVRPYGVLIESFHISPGNIRLETSASALRADTQVRPYGVIIESFHFSPGNIHPKRVLGQPPPTPKSTGKKRGNLHRLPIFINLKI